MVTLYTAGNARMSQRAIPSASGLPSWSEAEILLYRTVIVSWLATGVYTLLR